MDVLIEDRWEAFVENLVRSGRYRSRSEVVSESLQLMEQQEAKLAWLREKMDCAIARGGSRTLEQVEASLDQRMEELKAQGL